MSTITDKKITDGQRNAVWVQHQQDRLTGTPQQNKAVFDEYSELIREHFNEAMDVIDERISTNDSDIEQLKETDAGEAATSARESAESASESAQTTSELLGRVISSSNKIYTKSWDITESQSEFTFTATDYTYNDSDTYEVFVNGLKLDGDEFTQVNNVVTLNNAISSGNEVEIIVTTNLKGKGIADTELNDDYTLTINYDDGTSMTTESIRGEKGEKGDKGDGVYDDTEVKTDIAVLESRVDSFTHLAEGSTTGDAELIDARIGADGTTYSSAGDAVRGQVSFLNGYVDSVRIVGEPVNPAYVSGYITGSGTIGNGDTRTNFIKLIGQYVTIVPKDSQSRIAEYAGTTAGTFTKFIAKDRITSPFTFAPDPSKYYVMDVYPIGGGSYTPSTCPTDAITYYSVDNTDTSLSMNGKPADAKVVGDRFLKEAKEPIYNIRSQQRSNVLFDMQSGHGFYNPLGAGEAPADDTTDYIYGSQSVKFNYAGKASFDAMDLSDVVMDVKIKVNSITSGASINMYLTNDNTLSSYKVASLYKSTPSNQFETGIWGDVTFSTVNMKTTGTPDLTKAKYIQFGVANGTANYNIQSIGYRTKGKQKPCISFTFDDGWSEVMLGAKILGKYNIPATAYIFTGCELTTSQLLSLKNDYGWDIELHGDSVFTEMTSDALKTYIEAQQEFVRSNGLGDGNHMAYPGGQNNIDVVNIVRQYCKTARTINSDAIALETVPSPMPYNLHAVSGIGASGMSVANVKTLIDMAVSGNSWLILVFHRIGDTATSMFCSASDLEEIASYAVASGADIKTVDAMWERN